MATHLFGQRIKRREDPRLLTGGGRYVADIEAPRALHAAFVRSPHAHARIGSINLEKARRAAGVVFAACAADLGPAQRPHPLFMGGQPNLRAITATPLAVDRVRYVGEPVAVVVATDRYAAEDACDLVEVEYEVLPCVVDAEEALRPGAPLVHESLGDNVVAHWLIKVGDVEAGLREADHVLRERLRISRGQAGFMETRGFLAVPDPATGRLTLWASHQAPHMLQQVVCRHLDLPVHRLRVIAPDVGGGFGPKAATYPEDFVIPWLALRLNRPVRWIEDRREDLTTTTQDREQVHDLEIGVRKDGTFLALRDRIVVDAGAYAIYGAIVPMLTSTHILGVYKVPNFECGMGVAYSHRVPLGAVRGAGRPQGTYVMDRVVDLVARELKLDPVEIRFKNFVQPHEMPYSTGFPLPGGKTVTFDSGDYPSCLRLAMEKAKYADLRALQAAERARGRHLGVGIACYIEATTIGPYEGATVRIDSVGKVLVMTGSGPQGQGHETTMAQVCAPELGVPMGDVGFVAADTDAFPVGTGTFASRVATMTSNAVIAAARKVREKALTIAAALLEASVDDLVMEGGKVFVRGTPSRSLTLAEIAQAAHGRPGAPLPGGVTPGLEATDYFVPTGTIWSNGANIAVVEVDPETGGVRVLRYVVAHDCGKVINPMLVDGQIHGGVAHGISNALFEDLPYNEAGQPLYASFMDYLLPTAAEIPLFEMSHMETPSPLNPAGIKGAGESGTIPAHQAITAAVEDALAPFGVRIREFPLNPARIRRMVEEATVGAGRHA